MPTVPRRGTYDWSTVATSPTVTGMPPPLSQHDVLHVLRGAQVADAAHRHLLRAVREKPPPTLRLECASASRHVGQCETVRHEPQRVDLDVELLQEAAEVHHVGDARNLLEQARDVPLELGAQRVQVVAVARERELVDLAERGRVGRELGLDAGRQVGRRRCAARRASARSARRGRRRT